MRKNVGKNISKNLSRKYNQKILGHTKQSVTVASKTAIQKAAEANHDLIVNNIADKITTISCVSLQTSS